MHVFYSLQRHVDGCFRKHGPVENGFRYGTAPPAEPQVEMAAELQDGKGFNVMRQNRPAVLPENET